MINLTAIYPQNHHQLSVIEDNQLLLFPRWSVVEKFPYQYDFSTAGEMIRVAKELLVPNLEPSRLG